MITVERIAAIEPHPNADCLEVVKILGTQVIGVKGMQEVGDLVVYFAPDLLLQPQLADSLGVTKYLKHSLWEGERAQCRVAACRLRGVPSYGFFTLVPVELRCVAGEDVSWYYNAKKYVAPEPPGDAMREGSFHQYTNIEHYYRYPELLGGQQVIMCEKCHGSNCRVGLVRDGDDWNYAAGSHRVRRKAGAYWMPLDIPGVQDLIQELHSGENEVIVFGEIYGQGVQDMDYGTTRDFRVFDISVNGHYIDWQDAQRLCEKRSVATVPVLYTGPCTPEVVERYTNGPSVIGESSRFKGREGTVIRPLHETYTTMRHILKSVSVDYLNRKNPTDHA